MKKKLISMLLTVVMVAVCIPFYETGAFAASGPEISISTGSAQPGESIDVTINIAGNPGITSLDFSVQYDASQFELTGKKNGNLLGGTMNSQTFDKVPYYCGWINSLQRTNCTDDGILMTLTFKVKAGALNGKHPISFTEKEVTAYDADIKDVKFTARNGYIEVKNGKAPSESERPSDGNGSGTVTPTKPSTPTKPGTDDGTNVPPSNPANPGNPNTDNAAKLTVAQKKIIAKTESMKITYKSVQYSKAKKMVTLKYRKSNKNYKLDGYVIYKSRKKSSGFKKAGTTSKTVWLDAKLSSRGTTYYYKVRGFRKVAGKIYYTNWSAKKKLTV